MQAVDNKTRLGQSRVVPGPIKAVLEWDVKATKKFVSFLLNFKVIEQFKKNCKFLEWTCNGIVWLAGKMIKFDPLLA